MPLRGEARSGKSGYEFYDPDTKSWGASNPGGVDKTVRGTSTGGSSSSGGKSSSGTSTTSTTHNKPLPDTPVARTFQAPEYDEREVSKMTQQQAGPGIRSLRTTVQQAINTGPGDSNPNVKRMTLRDALAGYGQGLENVMAGASSRATNIYGQRHATDVMETQTNFNAQQRRDELDFSKLMKEWESSGVTTTTTNTNSSSSDDPNMAAYKEEYNQLVRSNAGPEAVYRLSKKYGYM